MLRKKITEQTYFEVSGAPFVSDRVSSVDSDMLELRQKAKALDKKVFGIMSKRGHPTMSLEYISRKLAKAEDSELPIIDIQAVRKKSSAFENTLMKTDLNDPLDGNPTSLKTVAYLKNCYLTEANLKAQGIKRGTMFPRDRMILKYRGIHWLEDGVPSPDDIDAPDLVPYKDYRITISYYCPLTTTKARAKPKLSHKIVITGNHTLADLRDMMYCSSDLGVPRDVSVDPFSPIEKRNSEVYKSGFFYINQTFYNDMRFPENIDYSEVIRKWGKTVNKPEFSTGLMEDTKLAELPIKYGFPFVYQHQGNCEHMFMVSDARLLHNGDTLHSSRYPYVQCKPTRYARKCDACGRLSAKFVVHGSDRMPIDPCHLCEGCYKSYFFIDGVKVGNFVASLFISQACIV